MEEERKQKSQAIMGRKKLEGDLKEMESQVEMANKVKEAERDELQDSIGSSATSRYYTTLHLYPAMLSNLVA